MAERGAKDPEQNNKKFKSQEPDIWEWLIKGTGTVAEPWPTAEQVLQEESVKNDIQEVKAAFDEYKKNNREYKKTDEQ